MTRVPHEVCDCESLTMILAHLRLRWLIFGENWILIGCSCQNLVDISVVKRQFDPAPPKSAIQGRISVATMSLDRWTARADFTRLSNFRPSLSSFTKDVLDPAIGNEPHHGDHHVNCDRYPGANKGQWPAPGSEDTELGVFMEPEVSHGKTKVYTRVQA
jgi:hypothetical protein